METVAPDPVARVRGPGRWWTSGEYLMWWTQLAALPPLVTTSSPQFNGQLGVGDTRVLLGGPFGDTFHSGARFAVGRWFGDGQVRWDRGPNLLPRPGGQRLHARRPASIRSWPGRSTT